MIYRLLIEHSSAADGLVPIVEIDVPENCREAAIECASYAIYNKSGLLVDNGESVYCVGAEMLKNSLVSLEPKDEESE